MAELFSVVFEVGGDAPVEVVVGMFAGLDVITRGAVDLAAHAAAAAVDEGMSLAVGQGEEGAGQLALDWAAIGGRSRELTEQERTALVLEQARTERIGRERRLVQEQEQEQEQARTERMRVERERIGRERRLAQRREQAEQEQTRALRLERVLAERVEAQRALRLEQAKLRVPVEVGGAVRSLEMGLESVEQVLPLVEEGVGAAGIWRGRVRAQAVAGLVPKRPYRFRSVRYENPLAVEIVSEAGFAAMGLGFLLRLVRDWSSTRRQAVAAAVDAESRAFARAELRRLVLERVAGGELMLTPEAVSALLSDSVTDAVDRLAAYGLAVEQRAIPGE